MCSEEERIEKEKAIAERMGWKYYLPEAAQTPEVRALISDQKSVTSGQCSVISEEKSVVSDQRETPILATDHCSLATNLPALRVIDPCMGSGHILVVMFDVLVQIYEAYGYSDREAASMIVEHNLYGLDIDERAAQLSYFAVMMKARQYDRRFFSRRVQPHVYAIVESNDVDSFTLEYFVNGDANLKKSMSILMDELRDAKEYGSILNVTMVDFPALYARLSEIEEDINMHRESALNTIKPLIQVAEALAQKYSVTCTNPPYMGSSNMNPKLNEFIKNKYADYKSDFFSAFVVRASEMTTSNGYCGFFTPYVWMFIQSYEKLRQYLYNQATIETLIQFEYSAFEEATVPVCTFAFSNSHVKGKKGNYLRLVDFRGGMEVQRQKTLEAIADHNCGFYYEQTTDNFSKIPGSPVAYWVSEKAINSFVENHIVDHYVVRNGISTGDNERHLKLWHEIDSMHKYWKPCNKGRSFRKWYGNNEYFVNWKNDGHAIRTTLDDKGRIKARLGGIEYSFSKGIEMSRITSGELAFRFSDGGFVYESSTNDIYQQSNSWKLLPLLAYCNTKVVSYFLNLMNPTINIMPEDIRKLPCPQFDSVTCEDIASDCISLSRTDWDAYETSWDFKRHPLL